MANNLFGILGGIALGALVALFAPWGVALIVVVALLIVALLPQFNQYKVPALMALLTIIFVTVVKIYAFKESSGL